MSQEEQNSKYLSQLVHIELSQEEEQIFNQNLKKILHYMDLIREMDTEGVLPCAHVMETMKNVMGKDEEGPHLIREAFLQNAPDSVGGMIKIPPIMQPEE